jgi:hypothetical protein
MQQLRNHPLRTLGVLLGIAFVLFMLSGIPAFKNAKGWNIQDVLGYVCWFGFVICALLFLVAGAYTVVRTLRGRRLA